ncbi:MAG TPA: cAMP/cGMP-dependent 3',5'-cyclic-AMP/GMP phosphodiesterase [Spirochaetota bacterium]|nr:cAMP/cGMP-dependent 3',5'-cyclic-AMP/GMP phosphodiesterase [Spirochaetota bacterium]HPI90192.1 cAMP/cGMP-dependent 3',5'-cyclic-AMP/GMP phosphodiesterase [Spirochaetota bacterium]HPR46343.1 cAMP/cGMP-dependent 3',5'-cyclic-AMP/GMP phosphodiesterase [Spirochaetota bacterium]
MINSIVELIKRKAVIKGGPRGYTSPRIERASQPLAELSGTLTALPRGGYLADTPGGYIQFGSPPETIKDTMRLPHGVPDIFVLSNEMFDWIKGISIAEIEFPIYYNFFIKKKKTFIICTREQFTRMKRVLQEAVFGPQNFDVSLDYDQMVDRKKIPDLRSEMNFFRNNLRFSDIVGFGLFDGDSFTIRGVTIKKEESGSFVLYYGGDEICRVPGRIEYKPAYLIGERSPEPYRPPLFGVTCLGPSHGFDPEENTSGYIIWLNHQGIMVDPPVNSTEWLEDSNVSPKFIDSIILTHCHADHDAGTFQKILEEGRVTVYSTETVMMSFLRKYSALSAMPVTYLMKLFDFHPVRIGEPVFIHGGRFDMFYTLHSIPTMGFRMSFQDQTFVYSSDHNNDPKVHRELLETGRISQERYEELGRFPWDSKVIYHEAGIPPLHTPVVYLNSMPAEIQKKTVVYHIAKKDFPAKTGLSLAKFGIENTLYFLTRRPRFEKAYQIMGMLKSLDFLRDLPISKAQEFIDIIEEERHKKGSVIIKKGTPGDKFYIIYYGNVSVDSGGLEEKKIYGTYDYFGEVALITEQSRMADVVAETDVVVFTIPRDRFLNFIRGTDYERTLQRLVKIRSSETWNLLSTSDFFKYCTSSQKTWLESIFIPMEKKKAGTLLREGEPIEFIYIIRSGEIDVTADGAFICSLGRGDFIGSLKNVHAGEPSSMTYTHRGPISLFAMKCEDIARFIEYNPGLLMKITSVSENLCRP